MTSLLRTAGSVLIVALLAGAVWYLFPTEARRIRAACLELAELVSVPANEPDLARVARVAAFARHLAPDIIVEAEGLEQRVEGRETVVAWMSRFSSSPRGLSVTLEEVEVIVDEDGRTAVARATATAREPPPDGGPAVVETRRLTLGWTRTDEGWRLATVVVGHTRS